MSHTLLNLPLPQSATDHLLWGNLPDAAAALALAELTAQQPGPLLVLAPDINAAQALEQALSFFLGPDGPETLMFPDQETLAYDHFSPLPELISRRLAMLNRLPALKRGALVVAVGTLMQRLCPPDFLAGRVLDIAQGDQLDIGLMRERLVQAGYSAVSQVVGHGEFAARGSLFDIFPMGAETPYRIDLLDDDIDSIRIFDPETQRSGEQISSLRLFPAREFPTESQALSQFRQAWRARLPGDPAACPLYQDVSHGLLPGGLESYLPLFFEQTATLFDYFSTPPLVVSFASNRARAEDFQAQIDHRYEQLRHDSQRPLLPPQALYLSPEQLVGQLKAGALIEIHAEPLEPERRKGLRLSHNLVLEALPHLAFNARAQRPMGLLQDFLAKQPLDRGGRVLFLAESPGRREHLRNSLRDIDLVPRVFDGWHAFLDAKDSLGICVAPLESGLHLGQHQLCLISESQLLGQRFGQGRTRRKAGSDPELVIRNLTELHIGAPVVHEDHGVGRFLGLQTLDVGDQSGEFLTLEYAKGDKLYVPVAALYKVSRYTGVSPDNAPLHRLGSGQWDKARRKAAEKARDAAAELLDIYARREANPGLAFNPPGPEYQAFIAAFPYEETPDQAAAIEAVIADMQSPRPMDRVVCGDVGFGKTEVAIRAAFLAAQSGRQCAILAPTTLLVQQHYDTISDRLADWPIRIDSLSRFRTAKEQKAVLQDLAEGKIDILVGTHKLLSPDVRFKNLALVIIDEEHRFGVRHKERLKALRANLDILTLTATPIPRTLNLAMSGLRALSIIATAPAARHPIKTFVSEWNDGLIVEACQRELKRGGQIYFLHNEVETIARMAERLGELVPAARITYAHGQMRETELEHIMRDFHHQRFNLLVSTTIIESGIDVPNANTIIINRADRLGLAQLHQLRGRVGRSHHRAYAYLLTPSPKAMSEDAKKRLEAIASLEELGAGFTLATHDLEIRGAGELLGDEQSGQIQEIGFGLYTELLQRAVTALKTGQVPDLDLAMPVGTEVDLGLVTILPEDYLPDVQMRLVQYKRIAGAKDPEALDELEVELVDRFGLLPQQTKNLFDSARLRLQASALGIRKLEASAKGGRIVFEPQPRIDPMRLIKLLQSQPQHFKLDGQDKLRFFMDLGEERQRAAKVRALIEGLALS